jgi:hypothetical protein
MKIIIALIDYLIVLVLLILSLSWAASPQCDPANSVGFDILPDRLVYSASSTMHVKFLVTNMGETPLYLFRNLSPCTSQIGFYSFLILDREDRTIPVQACSSDHDMDSMDVVKTLTNPKLGLVLRQYEIHGVNWDFKLPSQKGTYRLRAQLVPPTFNMFQEQTLTQNGMRVLECPVRAPIVTIVVR